MTIFLLLCVLLASWLIGPIRRTLYTPWLLRLFKHASPTLSDTERTALESGTVGWEGELFTGAPNWEKIFAEPRRTLNQEEQEFLNGPCVEVCRMVNDWEVSHAHADLSPEVWAYLKEKKFFGLNIPKEFGGLGFTPLANHAVVQKLASCSSVLSATVGVPNSLGPSELLMHYGTTEQKAYYLPRLASGKEIPCFALTGPFAGSDATSIPDIGKVGLGMYEGKETLGVYISLDKRYITLAPVATLIGVAFRMMDPDHLLGDKEDIGITIALVPRDTPNLEIGRRHLPLNVPFHNGPIRGTRVFVPLSQLIGGPNLRGQGWRMLMECLSVGRAITLPATSSGTSKMLALSVGAYARIREQFGVPLHHFEGIREPLAELTALAYTTSALSEEAAQAVARGENPSVPSTIAKYHTTEMAREAARCSMDILGGKGIVLGPRNFAGRLWQGAPIAITVEGANIMTRSLMIFGQGATLAHPHVKGLMKSLEEPIESQTKVFDQALMGMMKHSLANILWAPLYAYTSASVTYIPHGVSPLTEKWLHHIGGLSAVLSWLTNASLVRFGGKLKFKEHLSGRLGDVLSHLYICVCLLKQFEDMGAPQDHHTVLKHAVRRELSLVYDALDGVVRNDPSRLARFVMRLAVLPWRKHHKPSDGSKKRVCDDISYPSALREFLEVGLYTEPTPLNPAGRMMHALPHVVENQPLQRKAEKLAKEHNIIGPPVEKINVLRQQELITEEECAVLLAHAELIKDAIWVDDFDPSELTLGCATQDPA